MLSHAQQTLMLNVLSALEKKEEFPSDIAIQIYNSTKQDVPTENRILRLFIMQHIVANLSQEELFKFTKAVMQAHLTADTGSYMLRTSGNLSGELYVAFARELVYSPDLQDQPASMIVLNRLIADDMQKNGETDFVQRAASGIFFQLAQVEDVSLGGRGMALIKGIKNTDIPIPQLQFKESTISQKDRMHVMRIKIIEATVEEKKAVSFDFVSDVKNKLEQLENTILSQKGTQDDYNSEMGLVSASARLLGTARAKSEQIIEEIKKNKQQQYPESLAIEEAKLNKALHRLQQQFKSIQIVITNNDNLLARLGAIKKLNIAVDENVKSGETVKFNNEMGYTEELAMFAVQAALKEIRSTCHERKDNVKLIICQEGEKLAKKYKNNAAQLADLGNLLITTAQAINDENHIPVLKIVAEKHKTTISEKLYQFLRTLIGYSPPKFIVEEEKNSNVRLFKKPELVKYIAELTNDMEKSTPKKTK